MTVCTCNGQHEKCLLIAELESQNERLEREARSAGKDIALAEAKKRIAELEKQMHTYNDQCGCPWCDAVRELNRDKTELSERVVELNLALDGYHETQERLQLENTRLREALEDLIEDHADGCDCWHHQALKYTRQEISIGSDLGASRKTDRPDGPSTYRPDDTELMGKGSAKAGPDSSQSVQVSADWKRAVELADHIVMKFKSFADEKYLGQPEMWMERFRGARAVLECLEGNTEQSAQVNPAIESCKRHQWRPSIGGGKECGVCGTEVMGEV